MATSLEDISKACASFLKECKAQAANYDADDIAGAQGVEVRGLTKQHCCSSVFDDRGEGIDVEPALVLLRQRADWIKNRRQEQQCCRRHPGDLTNVAYVGAQRGEKPG